MLISGVMMLRWLDWQKAADAVERGLEAAIADKRVTYDLARQKKGATEVKTSEFGEAIIENL